MVFTVSDSFLVFYSSRSTSILAQALTPKSKNLKELFKRTAIVPSPPEFAETELVNFGWKQSILISSPDQNSICRISKLKNIANKCSKKRLKRNLVPHFLFHFVLVILEPLNLAILFAMVTYGHVYFFCLIAELHTREVE